MDEFAKGIGGSRHIREHQRFIRRICNLMWTEVSAIPGWDVLPEATVTDNPYDCYPDVTVVDENGLPVVCIEICTHRQLWYNRRKGESLLARFPHLAFFIYDYERDVLYATDCNCGGWVSSAEAETTSPHFSRPILDYIRGF